MSAEPSDADRPLALFLTESDRFVPTELSRGPWSPDALHGGPVAALVARAIEGHGNSIGGGMQLARLTVELLRPVPVTPLVLATSLVRPGRKVQLIEAVVEADGKEVAWGRALLIRRKAEEERVAPRPAEEMPPPPPHEAIRTPSALDRYRAFHTEGMEIRFVRGRFDVPGPATAWCRLRYPVVAGEEPSPWQRAAAAADFGNGIASELSFDSHVFINPELTVHLHRPPRGEWVCLEARMRLGSPGIGLAESALWDLDGRIGRAAQSLVVEALT